MKAEHASAIRTFDYFAAVSFGAAAALSSWYLVPEALPAPLAMIVGMAVGMASSGLSVTWDGDVHQESVKLRDPALADRAVVSHPTFHGPCPNR